MAAVQISSSPAAMQADALACMSSFDDAAWGCLSFLFSVLCLESRRPQARPGGGRGTGRL